MPTTSLTLREFSFQAKLLPVARQIFPELASLPLQEQKAIECLLCLKFIDAEFMQQHAQRVSQKINFPHRTFLYIGHKLPPETAWDFIKKEVDASNAGQVITAALNAFEMANPRYRFGHGKLLLKTPYTRLVELLERIHLSQIEDDSSYAHLELYRSYWRSELPWLWEYEALPSRRSGLVCEEKRAEIFLFITENPELGTALVTDTLNWFTEPAPELDAALKQASASQQLKLFHRESPDVPYRYLGPMRWLGWVPQQGRGLGKFLVDSLASTPESTGPKMPGSGGIGRPGQQSYRAQLLQIWGACCAVTKVDVKDTLLASHLKPYRDCTEEEAFDPYNGLLLCPNLDRLLDLGYISFDDAGQILISSVLTSAQLSDLRVNRDMCLRKVPPQLLPYLAYHRSQVFEKWGRDQSAS